MLKNFILATATLCMSSPLKAQKSPPKTVNLNINAEFTDAGVTLNKGDTLFMIAEEDVSLGPKLTKQFGRVGLCGYSKPNDIAQWKYDLFTDNANRRDPKNKKLEHHGALLVYALQNGKIISVAEYCQMDKDPTHPNSSNCRIFVAKHNGTRISYALNETDPENNTGFAKVTHQNTISSSASYAHQ